MSATGWAVTSWDGEQILVKTISDTRRAAIVNYLVADCEIPVFAWHTDEQIEAMWSHYGDGPRACMEVTITAMSPADGGTAA